MLGGRIRQIGWLGIVMLIVMLPACRDEPPKGEVKATTAYVEYFGQPPTPGQGQCLARVGYLPSPQTGGLLKPMPLFLYSEERQMALLIERLIELDNLTPLAEGLYNPFPEGTKMEMVRQDDRRVVVELAFAKEEPTPAQARDLGRAIAMTLGQFPGVERVLVKAAGRMLPGEPENGFVPQRGWVDSPGPPQLLLVVGSWERGGSELKEILIDFDRPVSVESLSFADEGGREVKGEYYRSAFDMAVVVHPAVPSQFTEGTPVKLAWTVSDALGRRGEGNGKYLLVRQDH